MTTCFIGNIGEKNLANCGDSPKFCSIRYLTCNGNKRVIVYYKEMSVWMGDCTLPWVHGNTFEPDGLAFQICLILSHGFCTLEIRMARCIAMCSSNGKNITISGRFRGARGL